MPVPFKEIPNNLLIPGQYQEVDTSLSGGGADTKKALILGQMLASGTAAAGKDYVVTTEARARELFGVNSDITLMIEAWLKQYRGMEVHAIGIKDAAAGVAAAHKITIALANHKAGTVPLYIDGLKAAFAVGKEDTLATIRTAAIGAINSVTGVQVEASAGVAAGEIVLTAVHKGSSGNALDIRTGLYGEKMPGGVTITSASTQAGSGNPDVAPVISGMQEVRYHYLVSSIRDAANMAKIEAELDRRYTAIVQLGGRLFIAFSGTADEAAAYADAGRNNPHVSMIFRGKNPESERVWAGRAAAIIARRLGQDPAANINGENLRLMVTDSLSHDTRKRLLEKGISTYTVTPASMAAVERQVTTYTQGVDGGRDTAYLDIQTPETIDAIREHINRTCARIYAGYKLANTNENFGAGSKVMTPTLFRTFLLSLYQDDFIARKQWCQDFTGYKDSLVVEASTHNKKTRIDYRHQPTLIGQFLIAAGLLQAK